MSAEETAPNVDSNQENQELLPDFAALGIRPDILKGLAKLGYQTPTPVQREVIPHLLAESGDLIALAQTGTGKTAAYGVPLVQHCDIKIHALQSLVLCPTRELCVQVAGDLGTFSRYVKGVQVLAVYGGADIVPQINKLRRGVQILVATPGRLLDLMRRGVVDLSQIAQLVLDESDEMLNMGFQEELTEILAATPEEKNSLLFSATLPPEVARIAGRSMRSPKRITIGRANSGADGVRHVYYVVQARDRYLALRRIADENPGVYALVFCRTRAETQEIADNLIQDGYNADALHGELSQLRRDQVMEKFRRRQLQILVATDVAARGLDVDDLTHVINYQLPDDLTTYTHRSGRTGRAGKEGVSISIIHMRENFRINQLQHRLGKKFERGMLPSGREICEIQLLHWIDKLEQTPVDADSIAPFMPVIVEKLEHLEREALIQRFVSLEFQRFIDHYRKAPDLNIVPAAKRGGRDGGRDGAGSGPRRRGGRFVRLELNVGADDGINPSRLIAQINQETGTRDIAIGRIKVMPKSTLFEADSRYADEVIGAFLDTIVNGRDVHIRINEPGEGVAGGDRSPRQAPHRDRYQDRRQDSPKGPRSGAGGHAGPKPGPGAGSGPQKGPKKAPRKANKATGGAKFGGDRPPKKKPSKGAPKGAKKPPKKIKKIKN